MKNIPNVISAVRIILVGVFVYFFSKAEYIACIIVYLSAFVSDLLDGFLARHNHWTSDLGKVLDPLADKLMLLAAVMCFYVSGWLPGFMMVIIFTKELVMLIGGLILYRRDVVVYADWYGKSASGFFTASVLATLLKVFPDFAVIGNMNLLLFGIAIVCALIALVHYAKIQVFDRHESRSE